MANTNSPREELDSIADRLGFTCEDPTADGRIRYTRHGAGGIAEVKRIFAASGYDIVHAPLLMARGPVGDFMLLANDDFGYAYSTIDRCPGYTA